MTQMVRISTDNKCIEIRYIFNYKRYKVSVYQCYLRHLRSKSIVWIVSFLAIDVIRSLQEYETNITIYDLHTQKLIPTFALTKRRLQ